MSKRKSQYTVEIELNDAQYVTRHDDDFVACSLVLKAADLLAHGTFFTPFFV